MFYSYIAQKWSQDQNLEKKIGIPDIDIVDESGITGKWASWYIDKGRRRKIRNATDVKYLDLDQVVAKGYVRVYEENSKCDPALFDCSALVKWLYDQYPEITEDDVEDQLTAVDQIISNDIEDLETFKATTSLPDQRAHGCWKRLVSFYSPPVRAGLTDTSTRSSEASQGPVRSIMEHYTRLQRLDLTGIHTIRHAANWLKRMDIPFGVPESRTIKEDGFNYYLTSIAPCPNCGLCGESLTLRSRCNSDDRFQLLCLKPNCNFRNLRIRDTEGKTVRAKSGNDGLRVFAAVNLTHTDRK